MNIYFNISENSGVGYYRQYLPAVALKESGLANVLINDFTWGEARIFCKTRHPGCEHVTSGYDTPPMVEAYCQHLKEVHNTQITDALKIEVANQVVGLVEPAVEMLTKIGHWADIIVFGRRDVPEYLSQWGGLRDWFNIPIVMDTDDNVNATRPFNPGYRGYHPGSEALHWNAKTASEVDAITVSTANLKEFHLRHNKNIHILPNSLEFDRWEKAPKPDHPGEIRLGLLLSSSHHEDAKLLLNVIPAILNKYPNVHLYYSGMFSYVFDKIKQQDRLHPLPWINLRNWPEEVCNLGIDIGLAPLVDNLFNRAKSNLRYLEYSAAGMAPIVSPVEAYNCVKHNKNGLVARTTEDWINCISELVEDEKKRNLIAKNAHNYVKVKFNSKKNAKLYVKAYKQIIKDFKKKHGNRKQRQESALFSTSSI